MGLRFEEQSDFISGAGIQRNIPTLQRPVNGGVHIEENEFVDLKHACMHAGVDIQNRSRAYVLMNNVYWVQH